MDMLLHNRIFFSKISNFSDKFEFKPSLLMRANNNASSDAFHQQIHSNNVFQKSLESEHTKYVLCLRDETDNNEMLLMWDMYTNKSPLAVKVVFNKDALISQIIDFFKNEKSCEIIHKRCVYDNGDYNHDNENLLFRKDVNYSFENEYRFVITTSDKTNFKFSPRKNIEKSIDNKLKKESQQLIKLLQNNLSNFSLNRCEGSLRSENSYGCYMPFNFDLIERIVISPYSNEISKSTITYLSKLFIFPEVIEENGMGWSPDNPKSIEFMQKIQNSPWEQNTKDIFKNAVSRFD